MNILFLSLIAIENLSSKGIYTDLLREFKKNGHNIYVISPREKRKKLITSKDVVNGVNFLKIQTGNLTKVNVIEKGISTLTIEHIFLREIKRYLSDVKFDLVLYATPPITFSKVIKYIKERDNAKTYLLLKDIFPQNAVDLGMFNEKSFIYHYFRKKEKQLYEISDYIGCMSPANVNYILKHNPQLKGTNVEVCPNSIEPQTIVSDSLEKGKIKRKYNIPTDKTIFIYGGNLGKPQGIDFLIECIKKNENNQNSYFLIIGSGTEFNTLKNYFENEKPKNAQLLSQLPKSDYETLANACDVGMIFLDKRFTIPNFPSRLLSYMQASMPVLAATDSNTDIGDIIEKGGFGYSCVSDDTEEFNHLVNKLTDQQLQESMGQKARKYLENNYTSQHTYDIIMKHFN